MSSVDQCIAEVLSGEAAYFRLFEHVILIDLVAMLFKHFVDLVLYFHVGQLLVIANVVFLTSFVKLGHWLCLEN